MRELRSNTRDIRRFLAAIEILRTINTLLEDTDKFCIKVGKKQEALLTSLRRRFLRKKRNLRLRERQAAAEPQSSNHSEAARSHNDLTSEPPRIVEHGNLNP